MRKLASIHDIFTFSFMEAKPIKITESPIVVFAREAIETPDTPIIETAYYKWLKDLVDQHGTVWGSIKTPEDAENRVKDFRVLAQSIKENGYKDDLAPPLYVLKGKVYGELTAYEMGNSFVLIDGHHRISIMYVLGTTEILLTICK